MVSFKKRILHLKSAFGLAYERKKLPEQPFTIISDDCWGGQIYRYHHLPYLTPTVGVQIMHRDYLSFVKNLSQPDFLDFIEERHTDKYPTIRNPYALILCVHYETAKKAIDAFRRRYGRIVWDNIFYKVDFGKPWYSPEDIADWNELNLPKSIAFTYPGMRKRAQQTPTIHRSLVVRQWRRDGAKMYFASRREFDIFRFLKHDRVQKTPVISNWVYQLCVDVWWFSDLRKPPINDLRFASETERILAADPNTAPAPYETEPE